MFTNKKENKMMKIYLIVLLAAFTMLAQNTDSLTVKDTTATVTTETTTPETAPQKTTGPSKWYYGGTIGFNFGSDYFLLSLEPMVGYSISPKFSIGGKVQYTYINDNQYDLDLTYHNYGGSVFARYRPVPFGYLHTEFVYANFENLKSVNPVTKAYETERVWVPFILVGVGLVKSISAHTSAYVEILFDVLQDDNSPYEEWDPIVHVGVGVGF